MAADKILFHPTSSHGLPIALKLNPDGLTYSIVYHPSGGDALYVGTTTFTDTAVVVGTQACVSVTLEADPDNTDDIFIGNGTSQPIQLQAGASVVAAVANVNLFYAKSRTGTQRINWMAT